MTQEFNDVVFRCIDETLAEVLGATIRDAIYFKEGRRTEDLPAHIKNLLAILEKTLGPGVTRNIVLTIAKRLCAEVQIAFTEKPNLNLVDYVEEAKNSVLDASGIRKDTRSEPSGLSVEQSGALMVTSWNGVS